MSALTLSKESLLNQLSHEKQRNQAESVRILFVPTKVTEHNLDQVIKTYSTVLDVEFETAVVIEEFDGELKKKLSMLSMDEFTTPFGTVVVNDKLRNEFCDEEDDFFVSDEGYSAHMSIHDHLPFIKLTMPNTSVLSVQISKHEQHPIIHELSYVLTEVLGQRNVLIIVCCDMKKGHEEDLEKVLNYLEKGDKSNVYHHILGNPEIIKGGAPFLSTAETLISWGLSTTFFSTNESGLTHKDMSLVCGYASLRGR